MRGASLTANLFGGFPGARFIGPEERKEVLEVLAAQSPYRFYGLKLPKKTQTLEGFCRNLFQRKYALAVSSGTAALHVALFSLEVGRGDEVILPAYGWSANLMAILALGAVPVIAPVDESWGLEAVSLASCVTKRTKAILAVHMRGYPCNLKAILQFSRAQGIRVLEDGAQCLGGKIGDQAVGSMGDVSILSFQSHKLVTSGEGGMFLTDDRQVYERACRFHDLGMLRRAGDLDPTGPRAIQSLGLNYRLSELQSALLLAQLKKIPLVLRALRKIGRRAKGTLQPLLRKFSLEERRRISDTQPNGAFLCLMAQTKRGADQAWRGLRKQGMPVRKCLERDPHHFRTWRDFMDSSGFHYRCSKPERLEKFLERGLFLELNPIPNKRYE